jgi:hypothetical protein
MKRDEPFAGWPRFDGAAAWAKLTPEQQREIGAAALEFVQARCGHHLYTLNRTDIEEAARLFEIAKQMLGADLLAAVRSALDLHSYFHPFPIPSGVGPICRVCGCSKLDLFQIGRNWPEPDLCAACGKVVPFPTSRSPCGDGP